MSIQDYILAGSKLPIHNHYQLRLKRLESQQPGVDMSVLKFSGCEAISDILRYEIEFTSAVKDIPAQHIINYTALFLMYPDGKPWESVKPRIIPGVITQFRQCSTSADETRYVATLEHRVTRLNQGSNNAIYQNDSIISMTENTFLRYNMDRLDFRFALNDQYPLKKFMMQFGESEYAHIARRLADSGISYFFEYDEENNCDVMVLADHSYAWPEPVAIPFRNPAGLFDGGLESVWEMSVSRKAIPKSVTVNDDYYLAAQSDMAGTTQTNPDYPALVAEDYRWGEYYPEPGKEYSSEPGQGMWYARRRQERYLSEQITFEGKSNCMTLRPGMVITTPGKDWPEAPDGLLIVSTDSKNVARDTAYFVTFTAVPRNTQHPYRPALLPWPTVTGTLPARISSAHPDEPYAHINADGLYRAQFGFDRTEWQKGFESCWLRLAKPYSGDTCGFHMPLLDSTGVAIAFENGDVDRPYIAYALHDSTHPDHVALPNYKRNVIRTPSGNKIRLEDLRGKEHIKISTVHSGKSQLSLGHLVDSARKQRGEGAELRTDAYVAVRGGKGVLLSTEPKNSAQGQQLDMDAAIAQLEKALALAKTLKSTADIAQASPAETTDQELLKTDLTKLAQPGVVVYGDAGIAHTTPKTIQQTAGKNLVATAGQDVSFSVFRRFSVAAGELFSVFANKLGIKLIAAAGKVQLQAQKDQMELTSFEDMQITSTNGRIVLNAKKELLLMCGGAGIRIKDGTIEELAPTRITQKSPVLEYQGGDSVKQAMPTFNQGDFGMKYKLHINGDPSHVLKNQKFRVHRQDGSVSEGITDANGESSLLQMSELENVAIELIKGVK